MSLLPDQIKIKPRGESAVLTGVRDTKTGEGPGRQLFFFITFTVNENSNYLLSKRPIVKVHIMNPQRSKGYL